MMVYNKLQFIKLLLFCRNSTFIHHCFVMVTLFGIPLIGTLFIPTLLGFLTFYIIWSLSTRKKDADCTVEQILPSDSALTVNNIGSKPKRKVFGNRADSVSIGQDDNSYSKGDSNSLPQVKLHYTQNAKRKVFGSKVGELTSLSLQLENNLAKKNTRKKRCKGKSRCCSKKKGPSKVLEGTIEIVKVFFGTQTGKSKVKYNIVISNSYICSSFWCPTFTFLLLPSTLF